jgi:hypothetical protein
MGRVFGKHSVRLDRLEGFVLDQLAWYRRRVQDTYFSRLTNKDRKAEYALNADCSGRWLPARPDILREIIRETGASPVPGVWEEVLERAEARAREGASG